MYRPVGREFIGDVKQSGFTTIDPHGVGLPVNLE
jgi:hypothetical protein